jgi:acylphosphatase
LRGVIEDNAPAALQAGDLVPLGVAATLTCVIFSGSTARHAACSRCLASGGGLFGIGGNKETVMRSVRLRITGRVQGVGYRAWAVEIARNLGLRGWVRNRADGLVEMQVTGDDQTVAAMIEAAREGPAAALVSGVEIVEQSGDDSLGFAALPTK